MANLALLLAVALFGLIGYFRGAIQIAIAISAMAIASLLAWPLGGLGAAALRATGQVPQALLPVFGPLAIGIVLFLLISIPMQIYWNRNKGEPKTWDKPAGAVLGAVWGGFLSILVMAGLSTIFRVEHAMRVATAELNYRAERRKQMRVPPRYAPPELKQSILQHNLKIELQEVKPSDLKVEKSDLDGWNEAIQKSWFSGVVENVEPVDAKQEQLLADLTVVVNDPVLMERFREHPKVADLKWNEKLLQLSTDSEIATAIEARDFRKLLDNPKVLELTQDAELRRKLQALDIEKLLKEVKSGR